MALQLPLFQNLDEKTKKRRREPDRPAMDELVLSMKRFHLCSHYLEMLGFVSRFPQYSIFNCFLLFLQCPESTMVATAGVWEQKYGRNLKPGAQPLIILAPMSPVRFLFDIRDTSGEPIPPVSQNVPAAADRTRSHYENTVHNASLHGIAIRETLLEKNFHRQVLLRNEDNWMTFAEHRVPDEFQILILLQVRDSLDMKYGSLASALGEIFCGHKGRLNEGWWRDRSDVDSVTRQLEAGSVGYLVSRRAGLPVEMTAFFPDWAFQDTEVPPVMISHVFQSAQYVTEMTAGLWNKPRRSGSTESTG